MCIGYLFMVPKKFSHRPPLYDLFDKAELCALSSPSTGESIDRRQHHRTSLFFFPLPEMECFSIVELTIL